MNRPDVTIVVCTYNRSNLLRGVLESLFRQETNNELTYEIVVVDNASSDDTQDVLERLALESPVPFRVALETSQGVAFARNRGIDEARGEWIYYIDDDEIASSDCVRNMFLFAREKSIRVVGGGVEVQLPDSCPPENRAVYQLLLSHTKTDTQPFRLHSKRGTGTGNLMLHRSVFDEIGVFDESLAQASEDSNLMHRIYDAEIEGWFTPSSTVYHLVDDYRISPAYTKWVAKRHGWNLANEDYRRRGACYLITRCLARLAQMTIVNFPKYAIGSLTSSPMVKLLTQFKISRSIAYVRGSARLLAPTIFPQQAYADSLDFRTERETFSGQGNQEEHQQLTT
ncbi:MAG: glycosyltransferase involved in cell wall biosynthesis [Pirellulaceae bacterium]|jgi:glycosyltransferase involved in cell wall biosynthesis